MYLCVGWYRPSQESEGSCIYVLGVSTKPGKSVVMYLCVGWYRPSQESEGSCIYVLVVSTKPGK